MHLPLKVNEIFYSLQCEGYRAGTPAIFIRLDGCNLNCSFCDTAKAKGNNCHTTLLSLYSLENLAAEIARYPCKNIIWTGGEPALQLTHKVVLFFNNLGYFQAVETNGLLKLPPNLAYISCSPKTPANTICYENTYDEMRFVYPFPEKVILEEFRGLSRLRIKRMYISPMFDGDKMVPRNVLDAVLFVLQNPSYNLSVQIHKLINIS